MRWFSQLLSVHRMAIPDPSKRPALVVAVSIAAIAVAVLMALLEPFSSRAVHDPSVTAIVSGDSNPLNPGPGGANPNPASALEGNFIRFDNDQNNQWDPLDSDTAAMRMGPIDFCNVFPWTTAGTDNFAFVDIVIENVTDFSGYQVRINFDATMTTFAGALDFGATGFNGATDAFGNGFLPYRDRRSLAAAELGGFVNLPVEDDANGHRANLQQTQSGAGTVLLTDTYLGTRSAALSADTPSANAPEGGLLVRTAWELLPNSDGNLLTFDIDADISPGTAVLVMDPGNPSGNITQVLPENHLRDFFIASNGPAASSPTCPAVATPTPTVTPPATATATATPTPTATAGRATIPKNASSVMVPFTPINPGSSVVLITPLSDPGTNLLWVSLGTNQFTVNVKALAGKKHPPIQFMYQVIP